MKIVLETIPLWDALKKDTECPMCLLMKKAEEDSIAYYLSSAIMTPEVRVQTNRYGFCREHFDRLVKSGSAQSLALVMDTYYEENETVFSPYFEKIAKANSSYSLDRVISQLEMRVKEREKGCLICTKMREREYRYGFTFCSLFIDDKDFRESFMSSKGLCLHHSFVISKIAKDVLKKSDYISFQKALFSSLERNLKRVKDDDYWMTQKYKSENSSKPWNGAEDAQKRAVYKLIGEGRVIDPL